MQVVQVKEVLFVGKKVQNAFEVWERIITFVQHFDIKYTNKESLGRKDVGAAFPLKKALGKRFQSKRTTHPLDPLLKKPLRKCLSLTFTDFLVV